MDVRIKEIDFLHDYGFEGASTAIYLSGCNFDCPYCPLPDVKEEKKEDWKSIDGVLFDIFENDLFVDSILVAGGEPTIQEEGLEGLCSTLESEGMPVKLRTNGSNPDLLRKILMNKSVDAVTLDVKTSLGNKGLYDEITGVDTPLEKIKKSIDLAEEVDAEFEVMVPVIKDLNDDEENLMELSDYLADRIDFLRLVQFPEVFGLPEASPGDFSVPSREKLVGLAEKVGSRFSEVMIRTSSFGDEAV